MMLSKSGKKLKRLALLLLVLVPSTIACSNQSIEQAPSKEVILNGAGASFPAPLYQSVFQQLNEEKGRDLALVVNYQSIGSGAGVKQFSKDLVDFGASDVAMKDNEIKAVNGNVLMLPVTAGSVVVAFNLPGVETLNLSRATYVDIFRGKITKWNDPAIQSANPKVKLPDSNITVIYRTDGSGTTGIFTEHLSAISSEWKEDIGSGKTVKWPAARSFIGAKGNEGVTAQIKQNVGSIGYIEYSFAKENNLMVASLQNKAGKFVAPSNQSSTEALAGIKLPDNLRAFSPDPVAAGAYPIVSFSWLLVKKEGYDPNKAKAIEITVEYLINEGQASAAKLGYVPLPTNVREKVRAAVDTLTPAHQVTLK
jgi:phosphate transport system substrate-binding protein